MQRFISKIEDELCTLQSIMDGDQTMNACDILEAREDTRKILRLLNEVLVSSRLDRNDRRIFYMYVLGYSENAIARKVGMGQPGIHKRITKLHSKIMPCGNKRTLSDLWEILQHPQSTKEASVPEVKLNLFFDSAVKSWDKSGWNHSRSRGENKRKPKEYLSTKPKGDYIWESKAVCKVPEYFHESFGDDSTRCGYCGIQCSRRKVNSYDKPK